MAEAADLLAAFEREHVDPQGAVRCYGAAQAPLTALYRVVKAMVEANASKDLDARTETI